MGYLSQKKKQTNTKEILNLSLGGLSFVCLLLSCWRESALTQWLSGWLFVLYIYTLLVLILALVRRFFWHALWLSAVAFVLFLNVGMGGSLFFNTGTEGLQKLTLIYQKDAENLQDIEKQLQYHRADAACLNRRQSRVFGAHGEEYNYSASADDNNLIVTPHRVMRSGEVLVSNAGRAGFADIELEYKPLMLVTFDFAKLSDVERRTALKNLATFINMQDTPVVAVGDAGIESWSRDFRNFMEKTGLEVKNRVIMGDGLRYWRVPTVNVLAYRDFGVKNLSWLNAKHNRRRPLLIELNF